MTPGTHEVVVEELTTGARGLRFPVCLDGRNACPPEDCGGPSDYAELLEVLDDPAHEDPRWTVLLVAGIVALVVTSLDPARRSTSSKVTTRVQRRRTGSRAAVRGWI